MTALLNLPASFWEQLALLAVCLAALARPLGHYMAAALSGERTILSGLLGPFERMTYRLCRIDPRQEMDAAQYLTNTLVFSFVCGLSLLAALLLQPSPDIPFHTALVTTAGYITGTNWQAAAPEQFLTAFTQTIGLATQNFLSAAVGLAVFLALTRGLIRERAESLGNFWADFVRATIYILLPVCLLLALLLLSQGVVQTFTEAQTFRTLEGDAPQSVMMGPMASHVAIKQIGTNGGGYTLANAAHPFENPTPLSNFLQLLAMALVPAASAIAFGRLSGNARHGRALLITMAVLFLPFTLAIAASEQAGNPLLATLGLDQTLGNMEGKELRFGATGASLWAAMTTATSCGATNAALDSLMPISAGVTIFLIHLGEIIFGGAGSGLYVMLCYAMLTVFIAGLMIGRSPEYFGKKIGIYEIQMISIILIIPVFCALVGTALALLTPEAMNVTGNPGAQKFNQILYAFSSAANNSGAGLSGLAADTPFYNIVMSVCIFTGRFGVIACALSLAGSMAAKGATPANRRMLDTSSPLFIFLLCFVIVMAAMAYIPAVLLGFGLEHVLLYGGSP